MSGEVVKQNRSTSAPQAMSSQRLVIDARAQLDGFPIALETAHDQPLLEHLLRYVLTAGEGDIAIVAQADQVEAIRANVEDLSRRMQGSRRVDVSDQAVAAEAVGLRADTVYDLPRLQRTLSAGGDPRGEALWRIRVREDLPRAAAEIARAVDWYPISRWYLRPVARRLAHACGLQGVSPNDLTWAGFTLAVVAVLAMPLAANPDLWVQPWARLVVAVLLVGYWLFDQADGYLARLTASSTDYGGWLDANLDELADLGLHAAAAGAVAFYTASVGPLWLVIAFFFGKYLFMYGLHSDVRANSKPAASRFVTNGKSSRVWRLARRLWHWPADADVRWHLLVVAVALGWLEAELAFVAVYYNLRWATRHVLLAHRAKVMT